jgi:hypothetical protein
MRSLTDLPAPPVNVEDAAMRRQIAYATQRLRRYRLARDRAQLVRLESEPHLYQLIAGVLKPRPLN